MTSIGSGVVDTDKEEWVKSALSNDSIVVNLLIHLHHHRHHKTPPKPKPKPLLNWTVRQLRSKSIPCNNNNNNNNNNNINNNNKSNNRSSPTTPLSWSAATSLSAGSKVNGDSEKTASKRSRKKKTLPELKEEEKLLVKERRELKRELTALRMNLDKQKSTNERLKRIKLDLQPNSAEPLRLLSNDVKVQPSKASDHEFTLPDLNMPFDDPSADVICRVG